jgi:UDP-3-O-[3-hydroxymyristoyl] N-acetylglucosamine deacetylase
MTAAGTGQIARPARLTGVGLHNGLPARATIRPAPAESGIVFRRLDRGHPLTFPARIEHAVARTKGVALQVPDPDHHDGIMTVESVEHILAALAGLGIWNATVDVEGPELPIGDGSAKQVVDALLAHDWPGPDPPAPLEIRRPLVYVRPGEGVKVLGLPFDGLKISYAIDREEAVVGWQHVSLDVQASTFARELAPARTFVFTRELAALRAQGRYRGASEATALLVDGGEVRNRDRRFGGFQEEMIRHKALDALGDCWGLLGRPVRGHMIIVGGGHRDHLEVTRRLHRLLHRLEGWPTPAREWAAVPVPDAEALVRRLRRMRLGAEAAIVEDAFRGSRIATGGGHR